MDLTVPDVKAAAAFYAGVFGGSTPSAAPSSVTTTKRGSTVAP